MRCLIVDDHKVVSAGLSVLIKASFPDWKIEFASTVGEATKLIGVNALPAVDLLLLDLGLGNESGLDLLSYLQGATLENPIRSIVISGMDDQAIVARSMNLGADRYLLKNGDVDLLLSAIHEVLQISQPRSSEQRFFDRLPERQRAVLDLVMHAYPNRKIAQVLGLKIGTIKNQMSFIMRSAGVATRAELVLESERCGYIKQPIEDLLSSISSKWPVEAGSIVI